MLSTTFWDPAYLNSNGNILAASHSDQKVIELDPSGTKGWEYKDEYNIFRARRR